MNSIEYEKFPPTGVDIMRRRQELTAWGVSRRKMITACLLYGLLLLMLLVQLLVTEAKFSQLSGELKDLSLLKSQHALPVSPTSKPLKAGSVLSYESWVSGQSSSYLVSQSRATWHEAEKMCEELGSHLVTIKNQEEQNFMRSITERQHYWIGLVEREREGQWSWVDGTDFSATAHFWAPGQPDEWHIAEDGEDCGELNPEGQWNDAECRIRHRFICEKEL